MNQNESSYNVYVIIVSYNFERWMDRCLGSLRESTIPVKVVVVDNCSSDQTTKLIGERYPEVFLMKNDHNEGFGKANNKGISYAIKHGCDFVFLLNQDAWIDAKVIETLVNEYQKHPHFGILSPVHLNGKGDALDSGFSSYSGLSKKEDIGSYQNTNQDLVPIERVNAAFWMLPRKTLQMVGGFSPVFYHYGEDIDYINRLHYRGFEAAYSPAVYGYHDRDDRKASKINLVFQLAEYSNINYPFIKAFGLGVLAGFKMAFDALFKKEGISEFLRLFTATIRILKQTKQVLNVRKETKGASNYSFLNQQPIQSE